MKRGRNEPPLTSLRLVDFNRSLVEAWSEAFASFENVEAEVGDFFSRDADCLMSPANSFAIMDGGLDLAIRHELGFSVERAAQAVVLKRFHGECPVGAAFVIPTENSRWPYLVVAPTMRVPEPVPHSLNAYLAFRAALCAIAEFNQGAAKGKIRSMVAPGLCTGVGQMAPRRCAGQMRVAWVQASSPARIPGFDEIHRTHLALRTAG